LFLSFERVYLAGITAPLRPDLTVFSSGAGGGTSSIEVSAELRVFAFQIRGGASFSGFKTGLERDTDIRASRVPTAPISIASPRDQQRHGLTGSAEGEWRRVLPLNYPNG
jgi:hypothetical protein